MPPPDDEFLLREVLKTRDVHKISEVFNLFGSDGISSRPYLHWDELRFREPPAGFTVEEWWLATKLARRSVYRRLPLVDERDKPFVYTLPDEVLRQTDFVATHASGQIRFHEEVTDRATRDRYLVSQLIEEAITSSQLEGASTSRKVARDMIRSGRRPRDRSEQMILNNFRAMQRIGEVRNEPLTVDLIREIHRIVTEKTLDNPDAAGRFQLSSEDRVQVLDDQGEVLHTPPPAEQLPERMERLCDFANARTETAYLPGVLRALVIHFMIGYEHPFEDGNGRTARALFYWSMLNQNYWLTEFLSVSRILKPSQVRYAQSFLHTETDENDLTYFFVHHLGVVHKAIDDLHAYLAHKMAEVREVRATLRQFGDFFNSRQIALLQHALKAPASRYSVQSHKTSHRISTETARSDLLDLTTYGLLIRNRSGKRFVFDPVPDLAEKIKEFSA
ncbi:Fic family protein [Asanoa iriomotensis]|uniref:Fic family protein n=2 Tax=Asanoa iriomotensis TaxID=234613 RepID=A0ABQ4C7J9_9ACTN|nr:Fic family protein [Asanoa iriomotensis]